MIAHNNLYDPVMYLINNSIKRHFNANGGSGDAGTGKRYIEGVTLSRDSRGRLKSVNGWEYIDYELNYSVRGLLESVDIKHRLTEKHLQIRLIYDDKQLLIEVEPEIMNPGNGDPGKMDVDDVTEDYNQVAP